MGLHAEIKENEMYSHDDPRMKIYFLGTHFKLQLVLTPWKLIVQTTW